MSEDTARITSRFDDFLERDRYRQRIATTIDDHQHLLRQSQGFIGGPRVKFRLSELRSIDGQLSNRLRLDPMRYLRALEIACHKVASNQHPGYDKECGTIKVAIAGPLDAHPLSPRHLRASSLRQLVCVEGMATRVSTLKPKIVESVHYCPAKNEHQNQEYVDATDPNLGLPKLDEQSREMKDRIVTMTSSVYPTRDKDGSLLETEFGLSKFKDHQTLTLQEMPEKSPMGQLPRSVDLILDHDLVDRVKPGDRLMVVGVFRALAVASQGQKTSSGVFRTVILVNNIQILGRHLSQLKFSPADVRSIRSLSQRPDILSVLGRSICPSIHGHDIIKKAIVLQLLSGVEKNLENGTHLRGDINILMVGDPSTAKSQLLRAAMSIAPLSISTTGKGSTGVGLTAAVTYDPDTRERRLEAGAMVLADRGLVCVDEFDKMSEGDRVSIHEAMEQQTITIAKAGIHASLNARCSVLAAANPVYGRYDRNRKIHENVGLPDSLLSRFDLVFVVLDHTTIDSDRKIAEHVVRGHLFGGDPVDNGYGSDYDNQESDDDDDLFHSSDNPRSNSVWLRTRSLAIDEGQHVEPSSNEVLQQVFLRKFLHFAKTRTQPTLTNQARDFIAIQYVQMRQRQSDDTLPVTARTLETIIRLATAHAKARLSPTVDADPDCQVATEILGSALYLHLNESKSEKSTFDENVDKRHLASNVDSLEMVQQSSENSNKRARTNEVNKRHIKQSIWALLQESGQLDLNALPKSLLDIAERDAIRAALDELHNDERILIADEVAYQL